MLRAPKELQKRAMGVYRWNKNGEPMVLVRSKHEQQQYNKIRHA